MNHVSAEALTTGWMILSWTNRRGIDIVKVIKCRYNTLHKYRN